MQDVTSRLCVWSGTRGLLMTSFLTGLGLATEPECRASGPKVNSEKHQCGGGACQTEKQNPSTGTALRWLRARPYKALAGPKHDSDNEPFPLAGEILARGPAASPKAYSVLAGFENGWSECHVRGCARRQRQLAQP